MNHLCRAYPTISKKVVLTVFKRNKCNYNRSSSELARLLAKLHAMKSGQPLNRAARHNQPKNAKQQARRPQTDQRYDVSNDQLRKRKSNSLKNYKAASARPARPVERPRLTGAVSARAFLFCPH